jgi:hypothetical protein
MKKSNRGQTVGNLSTRAGVHPDQAKLRYRSDEALLMRYMAARETCTQTPNHKNRAAVDGLRERVVRRQRRRIQRDHKARVAAQPSV